MAKPRIQCRIAGCRREIIYDRLMCVPCWMTIRPPWRKRHIRIWRDLRPYIDRSNNKLKPGLNRSDCVLVLELIGQHKASCKKMLKLAALGPGKQPPESAIERDLKKIGL